MQIKKGYLVVILGIGFMLINIFLNIRGMKTVSPVNSVIQVPKTNFTSETLISETGKLRNPASAQNIPGGGVTILGIRPENRRLPAPKSPAQEEVVPVPTGITKKGEMPTPKEQKEMNAKGIIIF